jgi:acetyl-CoA synthetase
VPGRDLDWAKEIATADPALGYAEEVSAEDMLFILYTSGSTGKPKGVVHTTAGYMVWTHFTFVNVFQYQPGQVFFCTADIGWITGHSYLIYGALLAGATTLMFEGTPNWPTGSRFWEIVDRHKVNILYTAPTAIRSLMTFGDGALEGFDLSSLRVLGSVGEPINEEAWHWYHDKIGKSRCPVVDTWWQTETGGALITALAGVTPTVPSFATLPLPGVEPLLVDDQGNEILGNPAHGNLCLRSPWPGIMRTTYGDHARFVQTYFSTYKGLYFTGDGALRDEEGNYRITGRVDDVINVSGHRLGTAEIESAINSASGVAESAVVGRPHDLKGQGIYAYVVYSQAPDDHALAYQQINAALVKLIGPIAKPDWVQFVPGLPKTRSGKIMRRILRKIAEGELESLGDTSTLLDPSVVEQIAKHRLH